MSHVVPVEVGSEAEDLLGAIERGEINPTFRTLVQLAHGLRMSLPELVRLYERNMGEDRLSRRRAGPAVRRPG